MSDEEIVESLLQRLKKALEEVDQAKVNDVDDLYAVQEVEHVTRSLEAFGLTDREIMDKVQALRV